MSKSTLILIIILFFIAGGLLTLALNKSFSNPTKLNEPPVPSNSPIVPETSLLFGNLETASFSGAVKTYSLPILINTGANKVTAVQLELSFDPDILTSVNITPAAFFKNPNIVFNKINTYTGRISYALAASSSALVKTATDSVVQGEGTLAVLTFESLFSSASANITFLPRTFVTAEGLESSALKSTNSAKLLLQSKLGN